ncbi:MAG: hypothetical protein AAF108_09055 [Planctomycetota bacterium]
MKAAVELILLVLGGYLAVGVVAGTFLAFVGVNRFDPAARRGNLWFRVAVLPGLAALWPLVLGRAIKARSTPTGTGLRPRPTSEGAS